LVTSSSRPTSTIIVRASSRTISIASRHEPSPTNHTESFTYDLVGNKKSETDANGERTQFDYDSLNRLILLTDAEGHQVRFDYDESGNQILEEDLTRGLKTETSYDLLNRPLSRLVSSVADDFSYLTTFEYEDSTHTVIVTDPRNFKTTNEMDGFDRVHESRRRREAKTWSRGTSTMETATSERRKMPKTAPPGSSTTG